MQGEQFYPLLISRFLFPMAWQLQIIL